jgi:hypothetical protein
MIRTQWDIENEILYCIRCGQEVTAEQVYKRKLRNTENPEWCRDCRETKTEIPRRYKWTHPVLGQIFCLLWDGDLNDDWWPIDENGELVSPGERLCGKKDCVKKEHVIQVVRKRR